MPLSAESLRTDGASGASTGAAFGGAAAAGAAAGGDAAGAAALAGAAPGVGGAPAAPAGICPGNAPAATGLPVLGQSSPEPPAHRGRAFDGAFFVSRATPGSAT